MYRFYLNNVENEYHFDELCRIFLEDKDFETVPLMLKDFDPSKLSDNSYFINKDLSDDNETIKRELYVLLCDLTGEKAEWGTLTGVRPLKLIFKKFDQTEDIGTAVAEMRKTYLISQKKADLLGEILKYQTENVPAVAGDTAALYIGIPFCPTRCVYCAFASYVSDEEHISEYFEKLIEEIRYTGRLFKKSGMKIESVYIGGGTPTTLAASKLKTLIDETVAAFRIETENTEFTVEAGRPDTIDKEKLAAIKAAGCRRISINPQSMNDRTLELIGRSHTASDIERAFSEAEEIGFETINADVIAGLPGESLNDLTDSLEKVIALGANNITVHTLSVKRGSKLIEKTPDFYRREKDTVVSMLDTAHAILCKAGFIPYYIYRQKHQAGALENIGYCRGGYHSIYNIRIMEEKQTVIGLGAGAIGKIYFPEEDRLERVANVSNHEIYCERFEEMLARKNKYFGGKDVD